jgi:hypothetical protein
MADADQVQATSDEILKKKLRTNVQIACHSMAAGRFVLFPVATSDPRGSAMKRELLPRFGRAVAVTSNRRVRAKSAIPSRVQTRSTSNCIVSFLMSCVPRSGLCESSVQRSNWSRFRLSRLMKVHQ